MTSRRRIGTIGALPCPIRFHGRSSATRCVQERTCAGTYPRAGRPRTHAAHSCSPGYTRAGHQRRATPALISLISCSACRSRPQFNTGRALFGCAAVPTASLRRTSGGRVPRSRSILASGMKCFVRSSRVQVRWSTST